MVVTQESTPGLAQSNQAFKYSCTNYLKPLTEPGRQIKTEMEDIFSQIRQKLHRLKRNPTSLFVFLSHILIHLFFPLKYQLPHFQHCKAQSLHGLPRYNPLRTEISVLQNHPSFPNPSSQPVQANFSQDQTQQSYRTIV